jgi:chromosome segregation ATPase
MAKGNPDGRAAPATTDRAGTTALDLVEQAADLFRNVEEQAQQFESQARALAEGAIQKLHLAEDTIGVLRDEQAAAEARIAQLQDELEELREALKRELARAEAAENRLPQLEMRARTAERRAEECENTLARIEEAIRTKLLREGRSAHQKAA